MNERVAALTRDLEQLQEWIERSAQYLPPQGPITVFIAQNKLQAFEEFPFTEGVVRAAKMLACEPYLPEEKYREELRRGRIRDTDLEAILRGDLGATADDELLRGVSRLELRMAMLRYPLHFAPTAELLWFVAETDALRRVRQGTSAANRVRLIAETRRWVMRDLRGAELDVVSEAQGESSAANLARLVELVKRFEESQIEEWTDEAWEALSLQLMWRVCRDRVAALHRPTSIASPPVRHRDLLLHETGIDTDLMVHEVLIPFCAAFLDQGLANQPLPQRDAGFAAAFRALYELPDEPPDGWRRGLAQALKNSRDAGESPLTMIHGCLLRLGVPREDWDDYLTDTLLALRGWCGIIRFLEQQPDRAIYPAPSGTLLEFLAIRLLLDEFAIRHVARTWWRWTDPLDELLPALRQRWTAPRGMDTEQMAFLVFHLAQALDLTPQELYREGDERWRALVDEVERFATMERRRVFHLAYERRFYVQSLDAIALHPRKSTTSPVNPGSSSPACRFQAMFCIDEREESLRRHLEEVAPDCETFGIAGFYGVPMYYRGVEDAHYVPLCPIVIKPQHWVEERVIEGLEQKHDRRVKAQRALGKAQHQVHVGSRSVASGAILSAAFGVLASVPLIARILFPRLTARVRTTVQRIVLAPPRTRLALERKDPTPGPENGHLGFLPDEMANMTERVLRDVGLTEGFSRLVLLLAHGSHSQNNPHGSAYDCGACGGAPGAPNSRALAWMLNDPRVRERMSRRGLAIPADTVFVGGVHDTCNDSVTFLDLDMIPATHRGEFDAACRDLSEALDRNAHERCRRFKSAPLTMSFPGARQHVDARSEDPAQTRPELGHATNGLCIIGRRSRTRGLFLDRRAFLMSYDPTQDNAEGDTLVRLLSAAIPVCGGINLEYFFSRTDPGKIGCGTKLPHNITSLIGVMDGAKSDLRTGLPWQTVEIHEPVRILFIVETNPETMLSIMDRFPAIGRPIRHHWVQFALLDPHSQALLVYRDGQFQPYETSAEGLPHGPSSTDWYRGWRDHLEFAEIGP